MSQVKWADYCITAVRYNANHTHIELVKAFKDEGEKLFDQANYSRQTVVNAIAKGTTFVTATKSPEPGKWTRGQPVFVITVNGTKYLKTVDNKTERDNLENLPEF